MICLAVKIIELSRTSATPISLNLAPLNKFYRALMAGEIDTRNIDSAIASLEIPSEVGYLTHNRTELKDENELFNSLLRGAVGRLSLDQQARLEASQADLRERTTSARLELEQLEQNKIQLEDSRAQLVTAQQNLQEIIDRNQEARIQAEASIKIEEETLTAILPVYEEGGISRIQVDQQRQRVNDRNAAMADALKQGNLERDRQQQQATTLQASINRHLKKLE